MVSRNYYRAESAEGVSLTDFDFSERDKGAGLR